MTQKRDRECVRKETHTYGVHTEEVNIGVPEARRVTYDDTFYR